MDGCLLHIAGHRTFKGTELFHLLAMSDHFRHIPHHIASHFMGKNAATVVDTTGDLQEFATVANNGLREFAREANRYSDLCIVFAARIPVHLNLWPDPELKASAIQDLTDIELATKYRTIRLSVASATTGTLINIALVPFLPTHAVGVILNSHQTCCALVNRRRAKDEIRRRCALSDKSAQIILVELDGHRGRAKDVCVGIFFKSILVAASIGFSELLSIPANADALHHLATSHGLNPTGKEVAHEALKHHAEAAAHAHPGASSLNTGGADRIAEHVTDQFREFNWSHFSVHEAPTGTSSMAQLLNMYHEGVPLQAMVAEVGVLGLVADGANAPALVGDVLLEAGYERHLEGKHEEEETKHVESKTNLTHVHSVKRKPVPTRSGSGWEKETLEALARL